METVTEEVKRKPGRPPLNEAKTEGFTIPTIDDGGRSKEPDVHIVGGQRWFKAVVHEQEDAKRTNILVTNGMNTDFLIEFDKEIVVPEGTINVLKEAVYTIITQDMSNINRGMIGNIIKRKVPRFSVTILGEMSDTEGRAWLKNQ